MHQDSFSDAGFEKYRKKTRKEQFLEDMDSIIPWKKLTDVIEPLCLIIRDCGTNPIPCIALTYGFFTGFSGPKTEESIIESMCCTCAA